MVLDLTLISSTFQRGYYFTNLVKSDGCHSDVNCQTQVTLHTTVWRHLCVCVWESTKHVGHFEMKINNRGFSSLSIYALHSRLSVNDVLKAAHRPRLSRLFRMWKNRMPLDRRIPPLPRPTCLLLYRIIGESTRQTAAFFVFPYTRPFGNVALWQPKDKWH